MIYIDVLNGGMLKKFVSIKVIQERLGLSDAVKELIVYSHVIPGIQQDAAQKIEEFTAINVYKKLV